MKPLNGKFIKRIASKILKYIRKPRNTDLEIVFLNNRAMRALNKRYKGRDSSTDVLSFKIDRREFGSDKFLGQIIISVEKAEQNAKVFNTSFEEELALYIIHGILHLFGYDDETAKDRLRMSRKESEVLGYLCKTEDLSKVSMRR